MKYKKINTKQFNNLLNLNEVIKQKGIKLIKSKGRFYIGISVFVVSLVIPDFSLLKIVGFYFMGISFFDLKNIYTPEMKRKIKNKIRGFRFKRI